MENNGPNIKVNLKETIEKIVSSVPQSINKKNLRSRIDDLFSNKSSEEAIDNMILIGRNNDEKNQYFKEIKPSIKLFLEKIKKENLFTNFSELMDLLIELNKDSTLLKDLPEEQKGFVKRLNLILNRHANLISFYEILEKRDNTLEIEEKMYILINIFRSLSELIPKLFYEIAISIAEYNIENIDKKNEYLTLIKEDKLTLGKLVDLITKFEEKYQIKNERLSAVINQFVDIDFRNKIAHESFEIKSNNFISFDGTITKDDKAILNELMKSNLLFSAVYNLIYQKEMLDIVRKNPNKFMI